MRWQTMRGVINANNRVGVCRRNSSWTGSVVVAKEIEWTLTGSPTHE